MLARLRRSVPRGDAGFTLMELVVVVMIIGILSAIAIPTFLKQATKARTTADIATLTEAKTAMATYLTEGNTTAPSQSQLADYGMPTQPVLAINLSDAKTYTITMASSVSQSGKTCSVSQSAALPSCS